MPPPHKTENRVYCQCKSHNCVAESALGKLVTPQTRRDHQNLDKQLGNDNLSDTATSSQYIHKAKHGRLAEAGWETLQGGNYSSEVALVDSESYNEIPTLHSHSPVQSASNTVIDFDDQMELDENIAAPMPAGFNGLRDTEELDNNDNFRDPGCLDDLDTDEPESEEPPIHGSQVPETSQTPPNQACLPSDKPHTPPEPAWSAINDVRIAQKFIWELQNAMADDCDANFIDNL
ncbi:uncharacterized protein EV420DRAFT_1647304 [Desarmillaria tabescens]|uniref:Uncharacterized protein n=1 Tax=Armillaria tabescens TaxID=1929756 RepID=A0AA39JTS9_ARMTA|nr:uncharacterized protein EV420DRAFT_1647304 [Desarmillaria tabescens]KAK0448407.1 hypothetical protein EV420DRAFT_1647304 [Desarmillaria tabescens]